MKNLVFFLEGQSEKALLQGLIPRLLGPRKLAIKYVVFQGKRDLEKKSLDRMKGWLEPDSAFVVLVDQDAEDCRELKARLCSKYEAINSSNLLIRIACRELESWYFGDLSAVEKALGKKSLISYSNKSKYREPDNIQNPLEELRKITGGVYQKTSGSREIAPHLAVEKNNSPSFRAFIAGVHRLSCEV